jgi:hypothetical protein
MNFIDDELELNIVFENMLPQQDKKVIVYIGRFSPPTAGHYYAINQMKKFISDHPKLGLEFTPVVVVVGGSKSDLDLKKNPLSVDLRTKFMKASGNADGVVFLTATNAFTAFEAIRTAGFEPIVITGGQERVADYITLMDKYLKTPDDKPIKHQALKLLRDEEAVDLSGSEKLNAMDKLLNSGDIEIDNISGSLARRAVELGFKPEFAKIVGLESKPALAAKMFAKIAAAIKE